MGSAAPQAPDARSRSSRKKRRADGTLRPAVRRRRQRDRQARTTDDQRAARRAWLDNFEPGARTRFFKLSRALSRDPAKVVWLRAFSREAGIPQDEAAPLLERLAADRGWMKLRTRDGMVVGIAEPKNKPA
jgi:hypothetical protein